MREREKVRVTGEREKYVGKRGECYECGIDTFE